MVVAINPFATQLIAIDLFNVSNNVFSLDLERSDRVQSTKF
jgi:hypothetical protein